MVVQTQPFIKEDPGILIDEIPLIGSITVCNLRAVDTEIPITIFRMQKKKINLHNVGNIEVVLSATIVENESEGIGEYCQDFVITPETLFLQSDTKGSFTISYIPQTSGDSEK